MKKNKKQPKQKWVKVEDYKVRHIWACADEDCSEYYKKAECGPDFYQDNGTLACQCGCDMKYLRTEIMVG